MHLIICDKRNAKLINQKWTNLLIFRGLSGTEQKEGKKDEHKGLSNMCIWFRKCCFSLLVREAKNKGKILEWSWCCEVRIRGTNLFYQMDEETQKLVAIM